MTPKTAILWLKVAIEIQLLLGAAMVLAGVPIVGGMLALLLNLAIDPSGEAASLTTEARLLAVIGGGLLIGWSALAWHVTTTQIEAGDARGVRALSIALLAWFGTDSLGSVIAGVPLNALGNLIYLALFLPPLIGLMRSGRVAAEA
jgi:hypothetical protein